MKYDHPRNQDIKAAVALIVTSDTRTKETDVTGRIAKEIIEEAGHTVAIYEIVPNNTEKIIMQLKSVSQDPSVKVIITSGGTGISPRDKTVSSLSPLFKYEIHGFGELFRRISYEKIGVQGVMSQATAGIINGILIFCLPGSKDAVTTALKKIIIPALGHMLWELNRK
jgi:molybdenum cofactor biosynthesis protein B